MSTAPRRCPANYYTAPGFIRRGKATAAIWPKVTSACQCTSRAPVPVAEARAIFDSNKSVRMYRWEDGTITIQDSRIGIPVVRDGLTRLARLLLQERP